MIDTHCHIFPEYYENLEDVINRMGNNKIIVSGTNENDNREVLELCKKYENVYGTLGIHPTEKYNDNVIKMIEDNIDNSKIVGIGEIGLDYYWEKNNKEEQKKFFIKQIELARKYNKCIVVHIREAINDAYEILEKYAKGMKIDIHCYSGSLEMAEKFINLGCKLGIGGVLTFKNNVKLVEVVKKLDLSNFMLETDSPFLTPEPYRGKRNEPYNIIYVANKIAEIKNIPVTEVLNITYNTSISQFDLI